MSSNLLKRIQEKGFGGKSAAELTRELEEKNMARSAFLKILEYRIAHFDEIKAANEAKERAAREAEEKQRQIAYQQSVEKNKPLLRKGGRGLATEQLERKLAGAAVVGSFVAAAIFNNFFLRPLVEHHHLSFAVGGAAAVLLAWGGPILTYYVMMKKKLARRIATLPKFQREVNAVGEQFAEDPVKGLESYFNRKKVE